jgi:hypothetical protein
MRKITPQEVEDEMVLAEPLLSASGSVLMGKGAKLRKSLAPRFVAWGVTSLSIEGEPTVEEFSRGAGKWTLSTPPEKLFEGRLVNEPMNLVYNAILRMQAKNAG